ncbi:MAG: hypothetical protein V1859_05375 [archaeon]
MASGIIGFLVFVGFCLICVALFYLIEILTTIRNTKKFKEFAEKNGLKIINENKEKIIKNYYMDGKFKSYNVKIEAFTLSLLDQLRKYGSNHPQYTKIIVTRKHNLSFQIGPKYQLVSFHDEIKNPDMPKEIILRGKSNLSVEILQEIANYVSEFKLKYNIFGYLVWEPFLIFSKDTIEVRCPYLIKEEETYKKIMDATVELIEKIVK